MTFFMSDDQLHQNLKVKQLTARTVTGDLSGLAAMGAWNLAGTMAQASMSDGRTSLLDLIGITYDREIALQLAGLLVDAGLWHTHGHDCPRCPQVAELQWVFHDWFDMGYDHGEQTRLKRAKSKELKSRSIVAAVWARDCEDPPHATRGKCRYCEKMLYRKTTRGEDRPHLDHVNPHIYVGAKNIVLACGPCNQRKAAKTPEQAGMKLLPPPAHSRAAVATADVSPGSPDAGTTLAPPAAAQRPAEAADVARPPRTERQTSGGIAARPRDEGVLARTRGGVRAGQGEEGSSPGSSRGSQQGSAQGQSQVQPRSRRRRGRGGRARHASPAPAEPTPPTAVPRPEPQQRPLPEHDAGDAPVVPGVGRFGSPYHRWSGPPSDVVETDCPRHGLPDPCWKCAREDSTR
ncbi:HNH endonuclease [Georgenia wangjunii]|uniref:HNH endonuclease n=1 Tax=Georgenia wangjunii TaxID=3117730 RepID=UPI002F26B585